MQNPCCTRFVLLLGICIGLRWSHAHGQLSWCDPKLCDEGKQHVACNHNGKFNERCPADALVINLKPHRNFILHEHNKRRNFIASGQLPGYYPASRMATLVWDEELQYLAELNLKACYVDHDECLNTHRFRNSGQSLAGVWRDKAPVVNVTDLVEQALYLWFSEFSEINSNYITSFKVTPQLENYGHFAETVLDRNTHVGCAMTRYTRPEYPSLYIYNTACNYASIYAIDTPIYSVGAPASECQTGNNPKYTALCSVREKINPNYELY